MAVFAPFTASPTTHQRHPRDRLAILRGTSAGPAAGEGDAPVGAPASAGGCDDGTVSDGGGPGCGGPGAVVSHAVSGASGRLVRRWLPAGAGNYRLDPGRRGALVLAAVVLLGAALAAVVVWRSRPVIEPAPALAAVEASETAHASGAARAGSAQAGSAELVVSVAGQVVRPGLVRLPPGARVADAVQAAGGPVPGTDMTAVNLARRLTDGEHVVVGPAAIGQPVGGQPAGQAAQSTGAGSRLDLNTATLTELDALPGVGPATAQHILDWRSAHGRFASVDQLREVDGIGEARFVRLRDLVMV